MMAGDLDYAPVGVYDDEDELLRNGGYAPAVPDAVASGQPPVASSSAAPPVSSAAPMPMAMPAPAPGSTGDLESRVGQTMPYSGPESTPAPQRPQWKDYAPAAPHGWGKVGRVLGEMFTGVPQRDLAQREMAYRNANAEYKAPAAEEAQQAETEERESAAEHNRAETQNLQHPKPKAVTDAFGLWAQQNPNHPVSEWLKAQQEAKPEKENPKDEDIGDYLDAHKLEDTPANRETARTAIANRGKSEPGNFMPLYDDKGKISGAWDPKSGRIITAPGLPGNTLQGRAVEQKAGEKEEQSGRTLTAFNRYHDSFQEQAPKLTGDDVRALQVLTSHQADMAQGFLAKNAAGVLDTLFGEPLTGYSEKAMGGIMTKDQYDKLSPAGQKMLADYFSSVIQNFANIKQQLGSVGRNPMQLQAEMNTVPLPYTNPQLAEQMFKDKFEDLQHNPKLAKEEAGKDGGKGGAPEGATMKVPGNDGKLHWSDGKKDLGVAP